MGRIRTIKPEFPQSQSMGKVSRDARLLFVQLWTVADDSGRTRAASRMLASLLYPYDDDAPRLIEGWLDELEAVGSIVRYVVDGDDYLEICKWLQHQKIDKPSKSKFPAPSNLREDSPKPRERSPLDQGPRTKEGTEDQGGDQVRDSEGGREGESACAREGPEPEPVKPTGRVPGMVPLLSLMARERILDLSRASREPLAREAALAGVTDVMCRQFLASMKARGKDDEAAKGLLVAQLRKPAEFVLWHKAETHLSSRP